MVFEQLLLQAPMLELAVLASAMIAGGTFGLVGAVSALGRDA
jgi:hypothetical protein